MTIKNKYILALSFLTYFCLTNNAFAVSYSVEGNITGMFAGTNNVVGVFHSGTWFNPAACTLGSTDKTYLFDYASKSDWSKVTSMLLAAYTANIPIRIGVVADRCYKNYPIIQRVAFKKGY